MSYFYRITMTSCCEHINPSIPGNYPEKPFYFCRVRTVVQTRYVHRKKKQLEQQSHVNGEPAMLPLTGRSSRQAGRDRGGASEGVRLRRDEKRPSELLLLVGMKTPDLKNLQQPEVLAYTERPLGRPLFRLRLIRVRLPTPHRVFNPKCPCKRGGSAPRYYGRQRGIPIQARRP